MSSPDTAPAPGDTDDELPPALASMWRLCKLGYQHEPGLMAASFVLALLAALPDALLAVLLAVLAEGVIDQRRRPGHRRGRSASAPRRDRSPGSCAPCRPGCSVASATESPSPSSPTSPGCRRRSRPSPTTSDPSTSTACRCCATRSSCSTTCTCRCSRPPGGSCASASPSCCWPPIHPAAGPARACSPLPTVVTSSWRPAVERTVQEQVAESRPPGPPPVPGRHDRAAGQGGAGHRHRPPPRRRPRERVGAVVRARSPGARRSRRSGTPLGWAVFGIGFVGAVVFVASGLGRPAAEVLLVLAAGHAPVGLHRRDGRRDRVPPRHLDGRRQPPRLARGLRRLARPGRRRDRCPPTSAPASASSTSTSPTRAPTAWCSQDVDLTLPAGAVVAVVGENGAGKTTLVKLLSKLYEPTSGRILVDDTDLARVPADEWRERLAGAYQDFFRFELPAGQSVGVGDLPRLDDEPAVAPRSIGPAPTTWSSSWLRRDGLDTQLGPDLARRRRGVVRPVAEAGAGPRLHARRPAGARARRADRRPRRRDRARAVRALRRRSPATPAAPSGSPSWCRTASPPCAWPTSSSCSTARGWSRSAPTTTSWPAAASTPSSTTSRPPPTPDHERGAAGIDAGRRAACQASGSVGDRAGVGAQRHQRRGGGLFLRRSRHRSGSSSR